MTAVATPKKSAFVLPFEGTAKVVSGYPKRNNGIDDHFGVDYKLPVGKLLKAEAAGEVIRADGKDAAGYGYQVRLWHPGLNITTLHGHLSVIGVAVGDKLVQGQEFGKSGGAPGAAGAGHSEAPHLHLSVFYGKMATGKTTAANTLDPRVVVKKHASA